MRCRLCLPIQLWGEHKTCTTVSVPHMALECWAKLVSGRPAQVCTQCISQPQAAEDACTRSCQSLRTPEHQWGIAATDCTAASVNQASGGDPNVRRKEISHAV